jgi:ABC-type multidrug transport system fused ATPase/permease subunit
MDEKKVFLKRFEDKLKNQLDDDTLNKLKGKGELSEEDFTSEDYERFRQESLPMTLNFYEKLANLSEKLLPIQPDKKTKEKLERDLYIAHLACTPVGATSFALFLPLILIVIGLLLFVILGSASIGFGIIILALLSYFATSKIPNLFAKRMRSKSGDQIIIAIFYIVAFMRFSSNFELATSFAANYLSKPLSLDFKRLLWELENAKYPTIKIAFDHYLEQWRDDNLEFLEAIYLIESSLYESEEFRRISLLDKALDTILQGNYEKMLHFAQGLRGRVSTFNMVGIILPILGLIILPLAASFGDPKATWEVVFILYDILLPISVAYFAFIIIFNRPSSVNFT